MSEKRYRYLVPYKDVFQAGDETQISPDSPWKRTHPQVFGNHVRPGFKHRRPITEPATEDSSHTENGGKVGTPVFETKYYTPSGYPTFGKIVVEQDYIALEKERDEWRDAWRGLRDAVYGVVNAPTQNFAMVEERANEWREIAWRLAQLSGHAPVCLADHGNECTCDYKSALAAYELKAKEGV